MDKYLARKSQENKPFYGGMFVKLIFQPLRESLLSPCEIPHMGFIFVEKLRGGSPEDKSSERQKALLRGLCAHSGLARCLAVEITGTSS